MLVKYDLRQSFDNFITKPVEKKIMRKVFFNNFLRLLIWRAFFKFIGLNKT